jgi:hypothetical protein
MNEKTIGLEILSNVLAGLTSQLEDVGKRLQVEVATRRNGSGAGERVVASAPAIAQHNADAQASRETTQARLTEAFPIQSPFIDRLNEAGALVPICRLAGREFERLAREDAQRRAYLQERRVVARLAAAAWNAMQQYRSITPVPQWLVELVEVSREAAASLQELESADRPARRL